MRLHERGEKVESIAALADTTESEVRSYLKLARIRRPKAGTAELYPPGTEMTVEAREIVGVTGAGA